MRALVVVLALTLAACSTVWGSRVYTDTWQPIVASGASGYPRLVSDALLIRESDLDAIIAAGGELIGYHEAEKGWARRAGSTGGTHLFPVETRERTWTTCRPAWNAVICESFDQSRWWRVAVVRVPPERWHELPPHLIPPESVLEEGVRPSALRTECRVHNSYGTTKHCRDWRIITP